MKDIRKTWVPLIKIALASGADIVGDWVFYNRISKDAEPAVEKYELPLFIFFIVACIMGGLTIFTLLCKGCCHSSSSSSSSAKNKSMLGNCLTLACLIQRINQVLAFEILLEDIPQFVLTSLISYEKGLLTPSAVFNMTTSAFNFLFNVLDIVEPDNDDGDGSDGNSGGNDEQQVQTADA